MDERLTNTRDTPRVIAPPPVIALTVLLAGLALDRLTPVGAWNGSDVVR